MGEIGGVVISQVWWLFSPVCHVGNLLYVTFKT